MPCDRARCLHLLATAALLAAGHAQAASAGAPATLPARDPRFISVAEVRQGMEGYGLTVFEGTKPERFPVKVIGVLHNFLPQQDIILIRSEDPRLVHSGIVAGMSGSPIYLDGRLAGALAYGWHFAKDPIAGVTPIANMLAELKRPLRGKQHTPVAAAANEPRWSAPPPDPERAAGRGAAPSPSTWPSLVQAAVPLSLAGFGAAAVAELGKQLEPFHVIPLQAGGSGGPPGPDAPRGFEPGSSISVELIRGDMHAAANGTVTWVEGDKVLAFGHPMFNLGEIYLPIATAEVHTVMASLSSSFKMASPLVEAGTLVQDRQAGLVADTSGRTDMIPVHVSVGGPGRPERVFDAQVIRHRFLTPMLAATVVANAAQAAASDVADATITVRTSLDVRGFRSLQLVDHAFSEEGVSAKALGGITGIKAIGEILFNPFTPANLERIDVRVDVDYRPDVAAVTGLQLHTDSLDPGSRPSLQVTLRPYNGPEYTEVVPLDIPRSLAGMVVRIEAAAGNLVKPEVAAPENLQNLMDNLRQTYPARSIVVTLQTPDEGLALRGAVVSNLPGSVFDTLRPGASTRRGDTFKVAARVLVPTRGVVVGKQEIQAKIKEEPAR